MADRVLLAPVVVTGESTLFLYGTLCDPDLLEIVSGGVADARPASLPGRAVFWVRGESFPVILPSDDSVAEGLAVTVSAGARRRLDFYEVGFGYGVGSCEVRVGGAAVEAAIYLPEEDTWPVGAPWSLADWQAAHGALTREAAREYMHLIDTHAPTDAARSFPQVRSRASSRLRARAAPSPVAFDGAPGGAVVERTVQPYTDYFAIQEDWLRIPRFDGSLAPAVKRACFLGGDAVTVVPFDPATQSVLVVRQFRHGPHARGDANPWCVEPPAGRIDAGETAEDAARRELLEETGITASALHLVAAYYPTPGAYSEHLTSYVAIADLSGADGRVGGVATEAEDIMSHVIPLDHLMALVGNGGANTGPLILTAQWLALHADTLG